MVIDVYRSGNGWRVSMVRAAKLHTATPRPDIYGNTGFRLASEPGSGVLYGSSPQPDCRVGVCTGPEALSAQISQSRAEDAGAP